MAQLDSCHLPAAIAELKKLKPCMAAHPHFMHSKSGRKPVNWGSSLRQFAWDNWNTL
jgi:hypothetical protein